MSEGLALTARATIGLVAAVEVQFLQGQPRQTIMVARVVKGLSHQYQVPLFAMALAVVAVLVATAPTQAQLAPAQESRLPLELVPKELPLLPQRLRILARVEVALATMTRQEMELRAPVAPEL
jgi:hypothetical protein